MDFYKALLFYNSNCVYLLKINLNVLSDIRRKDVLQKKHTIQNLSNKYEKDDGVSDEGFVKKILLKKAKGFVLEEITEEYSLEGEGGLKLTKRKVNTKEVAPDITALKALIEIDDLGKADKYKNMTRDELIAERDKLLKLFKEEENEFCGIE